MHNDETDLQRVARAGINLQRAAKLIDAASACRNLHLIDLETLQEELYAEIEDLIELVEQRNDDGVVL